MKQVIPFSKDIVFKTNIASITSISLEHEEKISDGEISGEFIVFGDYKIHNDTTERELFKYKLPFTTLIPDNVIPSSVSIDVENFTYETVEDDVLKINIDFSIEGEEAEIEEERLEAIPTNNAPTKLAQSSEEPMNQEASIPPKETEISNELNFFLDNKILSNLASIEELREKENKEYLNNDEPKEEIDIGEEKDRIEESEKTTQEPVFEEQIISEPLPRSEIVQSPKEPEEIKPKEEPLIIEAEIISERTSTPNQEQASTPDSDTTLVSKENRDSEELNKMVTEHDVNSEYVTYHIHIVSETETLDTIIKNYNSNIDTVSLYNDITSLKAGDKLIIPEYLDE